VRYCHTFTHSFMKSTGYCCQLLLKLEFSRHIFKNAKKLQIQNLLKIRPMVAIEYSLCQKAKHPPFNEYFIRKLPDRKSHPYVHN